MASLVPGSALGRGWQPLLPSGLPVPHPRPVPLHPHLAPCGCPSAGDSTIAAPGSWQGARRPPTSLLSPFSWLLPPLPPQPCHSAVSHPQPGSRWGLGRRLSLGGGGSLRGRSPAASGVLALGPLSFSGCLFPRLRLCSTLQGAAGPTSILSHLCPQQPSLHSGLSLGCPCLGESVPLMSLGR